MILLLIWWKAVNKRWWHAFYSDCFTTLWKARFFSLCACTDTPALSNLRLWCLHLADLLILCLEILDWLNLLSGLFDWGISTKALFFRHANSHWLLLGLRAAEHMNWISIPCRLSIDHLRKNIRRVAHAWTGLRASSWAATLPVTLWSTPLHFGIQSVTLRDVCLVIPFVLLLLHIFLDCKEAFTVGPLEYCLFHHFLTLIVNFFLWII